MNIKYIFVHYRKIEMAKWTPYTRTFVFVCIFPGWMERNETKPSKMNEGVRKICMFGVYWEMLKLAVCISICGAFLAEGNHHVYIHIMYIRLWTTHTHIRSKDSAKNRQFNRIKHGRELWTVLNVYTVELYAVRTSQMLQFNKI